MFWDGLIDESTKWLMSTQLHHHQPYDTSGPFGYWYPKTRRGARQRIALITRILNPRILK